MATGDVFRSYQPSGDGRDVHLFLSAAGTMPWTAKNFDNFRKPPYNNVGSKDNAKTAPPIRFCSDGSGRDGFQGDRVAPYTGKQFDPFNSPSSALPPKPSKGFHYAKGVRAGYMPNGTGRDLQLFVDDGCAVPATGYQYSAKPPSSKRFQQPAPACRTEPPAKTKPNGSGRDLFQIATGGSSKIPVTSVVFSEVAPSPKGGKASASTAPPPRYVPSGSGRDGFHRVEKYSDQNDPADAFGFGPPRWDPAEYFRPKTSSVSSPVQRRRMGELSRPRVSTAPSDFGLLVPGSNLRK